MHYLQEYYDLHGSNRHKEKDSPDGQVVGFAARVAEVDDAETLRQGLGQVLDVLAEGFAQEALRGGQPGQLALTGSNHLKI